MKFEGKGAKSKDVRWDDQVPGFGVRLWASGKKTFLYKYRFHGRQRYLGLGRYGSLTLDQARKLAQNAAHDVSRGVDPLAEKQKAARGETVADLCREYVAKWSRIHNKTWEKDQERVELYILGRPAEHDPETGELLVEARPAPLPGFRSLKVAAVTRKDVTELNRRIGVELGFPTTANRVMSLLSSMFNRARLDLGMLPQSAPNPAESIKRFPEKSRRRFVRKGEMPALAAAINQEPNVLMQGAIWGYLLTGLRYSKLLELQWTVDQAVPHVNMAAGEIYLPEEHTKSGRVHRIEFNELTRELFSRMWELRFVGNPYVFPGYVEGRPLVNIYKAWGRIKLAAGLVDVKPHDLRRTLGSWLAGKHGNLLFVGEALDQSNERVKAVYGIVDTGPVAAALADYANDLARHGGLLPLPREVVETSGGPAHPSPSGPAPDSASDASADEANSLAATYSSKARLR